MNAPTKLTTPAEVTGILHDEITLTRAMGLTVTFWDGTTVTLAAPLEPNQNHTDTAFGGSIASIAILAGYTLLFLTLRDREISTRLLIQKSMIEYRLPIDGAFTANASCPTPAAMEAFLEGLLKKRRARMELMTQVHCRGTVAATHTGLYVAMLY